MTSRKRARDDGSAPAAAALPPPPRGRKGKVNAPAQAAEPVTIQLSSDDDDDLAALEDPKLKRRSSGRIESKRLKNSSELLLVYPNKETKGCIHLTYGDLRRLRHAGKMASTQDWLLNDCLVDYYVQALLIDKLSAAARARVHIFNSYFMKRLRASVVGKTDPDLKLVLKWVQASGRGGLCEECVPPCGCRRVGAAVWVSSCGCRPRSPRTPSPPIVRSMSISSRRT